MSPRCKFDHQFVLQQAMGAFYLQGYYATSMQDIFSATGLKPGSLYSSFGNKSQLFGLVVNYYAQKGGCNLQRHLDEQADPERAICALLYEYMSQADEADYRGCLLFNAQLELTHHDPELKALVESHLNKIEAHFQSMLVPKYGELQAKLYAASLMLQIAGMRTYAYRHPQPEVLVQVVKQGLSWLPW